MIAYRAGPHLGTIRDALMNPIARGGYLWSPIDHPQLFPLAAPPSSSASSFESHLLALQPFFGDIDVTHAARAAAIPIEMRDLDPSMSVLEMWHGPTRSFKDVGVRFSAAIYGAEIPNGRTICATSGDTGAAVADAFGDRATIYFPAGRVSKEQEKQMRDSRAKVFAINGDFDECQATVKARIAREPTLLSVNSISLVRLLPQVAFHAWAAAMRPDRVLVVPSGNLGNAYSAALARKLGARIAGVHVANNANCAAARAIAGRMPIESEIASLGGKSRRTPATAMDVCSPSNWPRLRELGFEGVTASFVLDHEIVQTQEEMRDAGRPICPHTAVGVAAARGIFPRRECVVIGTACESKF